MNIKSLTNDELVQLFIDHSCSLAGIDKSMGLSKNTSLRLFRKRGIDYTKIKVQKEQEEREKYEENPKICRHCGKPIPWEKRLENSCYCSRSCAASENNLGRVRNPFGSGLKRTEKTKKVKICPICGEQDCTNEFCKNHNIQQLNSLADHIGFDKSTIGTKKVFEEFNKVRQIVYNLYWNEGYSRIDLGKKFNYTNNLMPSKVLKNTLGIPTRTLAAAIENSIKLNKTALLAHSNRFDFQHHISWSGETVFLRSSYEKRFAEQLDSEKTKYKVEELRIEYYDSQQNRTRIAIPDFYLPEANEIIEIKSDFTLDIQEMRDKFLAYKQQGYTPKLILENEEIDLENLENLISGERLERIKTKI